MLLVEVSKVLLLLSARHPLPSPSILGKVTYTLASAEGQIPYNPESNKQNSFI